MKITSCSSSSTRSIDLVIRRDSFQLDPESAAALGFGFNSDAPSHALSGFAHDRQPDPGAFVFVTGVDSFKDPKNSTQIFLLYPNSIVLEPDPHLVVERLGPDPHARNGAWRDK